MILDDIMYKIDSKDKQILYLLHKNCRQSNSQIGRIIGLSKDGVKYRINKLVKDGIIRSFFLNIKTIEQGYATYNIFLRLHNADASRLKDIIELLTKNKYIIYCSAFFGKWDIAMQISSRSVFAFERHIEEIIKITGDQLSDYEMFISIKEYKVYNNITDDYFEDIHLPYTEPEAKPFKRINLDKLDKDILGQLCFDARMPLHIIGKKVNSSLDVVRYRLKRIENNGYLYNYGVILDHVKLGYSLNTLFINMHNMTKQKEIEFQGFINQNQNIRWAQKILGRNVVLIETLTDSQEAFQDLINSIKNRFSDIISSYDSILEFQNHKDITLPDLDELDN